MSGPDDMAFVDAPPRDRRLKRSNTAPPKKQESGGFMGLFDSLRKGTRPDRPERPEMPERRKSRSYRDDDGRYPPEMDRDGARRSRREDRRRGSVRPDTDAEGFVTDAAGVAAGGEMDDEAEARRAARHARRGSRKAPSDSRESEAREAEERRARRKERAREQRAREEEEEERLREEDRLREEKRARRAAREERRAREEQAAREAEAEAAAEARAAEARAAERRERRRMREEEMMAARASRRREREQRIPDEVYHDEREVDRRGARSSRAFEEPNTRRRKSKVAPEPIREPLMTGGLNRGGGPKDKISSWVYSQSDEPPEPPQIVPTLIDLPPLAADDGGNAHSLSSDEEARRALRRKARRRAKYEEEMEDARSRHRGSRREGVKSSSGSGDYERDRGMRSHPGSRQDAPPPSYGAKKPSWFRKLTNL